MSHTSTDLKSAVRRELISRRDGLTPCDAFDETIIKCVTSLDAYAKAEKIFTYISVGSEAPTRKLIERFLDNKKQVFIPKCRKGGVMDALRMKSSDDLIDGKYGIPTVKSSDTEVCEAESFDLIIVPAVAFSKKRERMGYGGGYYDRFLRKAAKAVKIGLNRSEMIEKTLPTEPHDEKIDILITEKGFFEWN